MRKVFLPLMASTVILLASSCNNDKEGSGSDNGTIDSTENKTETQQTTGADRATINLTITGGDMNGSYTATCKDACCSWGIAGENVLGNQYSETGKAANELSSVQMIIDDVTGNKSTTEFTLTVSFGELFGENSKSFNINTRQGKKEGSGTADVQYSGDKAVVTIKGVSKEGPAIDLKLDCHKVMNASNIGQD